MVMKREGVYVKAVEKTRCPFMKEDGSGFKEGEDPGSCPCMYPLPCAKEILIPLSRFRLMRFNRNGQHETGQCLDS